MEDFDKYKMFRNYMCNELGITRQDIEMWTKQSVANEVEKRLNSLNVNKMAMDAVAKAVNVSLGSTYGNYGGQIREAIAKELTKGLKVVIMDEVRSNA